MVMWKISKYLYETQGLAEFSNLNNKIYCEPFFLISFRVSAADPEVGRGEISPSKVDKNCIFYQII